MRTKSLWLLVTACAAGTGLCTSATSVRTAPTAVAVQQPRRAVPSIDVAELTTLLESVVARGMRDGRIPGAAFVLVQNGRIVTARGFGVADVASKRAVSPETTVFPIASISKVFTATAVVQLADRGRFDLNADVNRYLKSVRVPATYPDSVTAAQLLSHTSGFDELPGRRARAASELMPLGRFLADRLVRVRPPGRITSYSSYGMALAGLLVEDVSGVSFEGYLRRNIFRPLGMTRTFITVPSARRGDLAKAYERDGERLVAVPYELYQTPPTSSILSTARDMAQFMLVHLQAGRHGHARILSAEAVARMHEQQATVHPLIPGWAVGFQVDDSNGQRILEHGGDIGGFSALLTLLPEHGVGFFTVHHLEGTNLRYAIRRAILDRFFPDQRVVSLPEPRADAAGGLRRFAGKYRASIFCHSCPDGGPNVQDFDVQANGDGTLTVWDQRWVEVSPLYFVRLDGRAHIGFAADESGRITALSGGSWRVLERIN